MKVGRDYAWYVAYSWTYEWLETEEGQWIRDRDFDEGRFYCLKKDIKAEVKKTIERGLKGLLYRNLEFTIDDQYMTTADEL